MKLASEEQILDLPLELKLPSMSMKYACSLHVTYIKTYPMYSICA